MIKKRIFSMLGVLGLAASVLALVATSTAGALTVQLEDGDLELDSGESIVMKWTFMDFYKCAQNGGVKQEINSNDEKGNMADDILTGSGGSYDLPTGMTSDKNNKWSCAKAFKGEKLNWHGTSGVMDYLGSKNLNWTSDGSSIEAFLTKLGYDSVSTSDEEGAIDIYATFTCTNGDADGNGVSSYMGNSESFLDKCRETYNQYGDNGKIYLGKIKANGTGWFGNIKYATADLISWTNAAMPVFVNGTSSKVTVGFTSNYDYEADSYSCSQQVVSYNKTSFAQTANELSNALSGLSCTIRPVVSAFYGAEGTNVYEDGTEDRVAVDVSFSNTIPGEIHTSYNWQGADVMLSRMGYSASDLVLTEDEMYHLLEFYVKQALKIKNSSQLNEKVKCATELESNTNHEEVYLKSGGKWKVYYYDPSDVKKTSGFNVQNSDLSTSQISFEEVKARLKQMADQDGGASATDEDSECTDIDDTNKVKNKVVNNGESTKYSSANDDPTEKCYQNADVGGHILCFVLTSTSQMVDQIYYFIENNFLMVNAEALLQDGGQTQMAWGVFRDIANVAFVIVLLIVIFSQLTGYGIDNYGVKRILPRLIVTAVLVNASFIICKICVDISNIVGVNLNSLLSSAVTLDGVAVGAAGSSAGAAIGASAIASVGSGVALIGLGVINPGVILSLIVGIIGVIISLLFLFVMLLARQIGVVVCVVLAPVAIVCYMLPNTESLFKSWRKIFSTLLMAYPLCALAKGGGTLVSNLFANISSGSGKSYSSTSDVVLLIGALIINVLPIFFIPSLIKKSMNALGSLGATLSGVGQRLSRGATGRMQNSDGMKALQQAGKTFQTRRKAGLDRDGNLTKRGERRSRFAESRFGQAIGYDSLLKSRVSAVEDAVTARDLTAGQLVAGAKTKRFQNQVDATKQQATQSGLINNLTQNGNYAGSGMDFSFEDGTLGGAAYKAALAGDQEGMYAYVEMLSDKGHAGQEEATQVISRLQAEGNDAAAQTMAQAIMNNGKLSAAYKSGARSQYNGLKNLASAKDPSQVANIRSASNIKAGDYSKSSLASSDKEELTRIASAIRSGQIDQKEAAKIKEMAQGALNDSMIEGGTKLKNEEIMRQIAGVSSDSGPELKIPQNNNSNNTAPMDVSETLNMMSDAQNSARGTSTTTGNDEGTPA